jgi:hypothetical protein
MELLQSGRAFNTEDVSITRDGAQSHNFLAIRQQTKVVGI